MWRGPSSQDSTTNAAHDTLFFFLRPHLTAGPRPPLFRSSSSRPHRPTIQVEGRTRFVPKRALPPVAREPFDTRPTDGSSGLFVDLKRVRCPLLRSTSVFICHSRRGACRLRLRTEQKGRPAQEENTADDSMRAQTYFDVLHPNGQTIVGSATHVLNEEECNVR